MILFVLKCASDHRFEAWFRNGAAYEEQAAANAIACPVCGDVHITKAPMAPRIAKGRSRDETPAAPPSDEAATAVSAAMPVPAPAPATVSAPPTAPGDDARQQAAAEMHRQLGELRRLIEANCDDVGDRFAEEARRIHYGETDPHGIYGQASPDEVEELREEGVTIHRIPWLPRTNS